MSASEFKDLVNVCVLPAMGFLIVVAMFFHVIAHGISDRAMQAEQQMKMKKLKGEKK